MLRSKEMLHMNVRLMKETAFEAMSMLGQIPNSLEFINLSTEEHTTKKNFYQMISRCDMIDSKIESLLLNCAQFSVEVADFPNFETYSEILSEQLATNELSNLDFLDAIDLTVTAKSLELNELVKSHNNLKLDIESLSGKKSVISKVITLFKDKGINLEEKKSNELHIVAGLMKAEDESKLRRAIFRVTRFKATPYFFELKNNEVCK